ncbi:hypothetical protein SAMN02745216_03207 [Desulfatibacillum alkenivorans DSM 16219]|jgi:hypothetical protein|uniref:Uncharacterized protein n=1 Tax=Desulfatibacillum alkenivorans DSM 16219 TaxID=1121393 RepID=A0A1M6R6V8_9BACT|nr:hypothetical protein [Desulfatibacillum alkenivorans]SHK28219.1 hypothetical protein SAMN02745216_03207 [Desulfatibacillum alkenivorans DSM 16219]
MKSIKEEIPRIGSMFILALFALSLFACSSSDSGYTEAVKDAVEKGVAAITGSVGGTIIVAVADNEIVAQYDTAGQEPDLDLDGDGVKEAYSFNLQGIPVGVDVQVFIIEDGWIFPVYFADGSGGTTNLFSLGSQADVDFGYIDPNNEDAKGIALAANNIVSDTPDLSPGMQDTSIPEVLYKAEILGLSLKELVAQGLDALKEGWMCRAKCYFEAAAALEPEDDKEAWDAANFFLAGTRVVYLWHDMSDSYTPGGELDNFGEILDRFGFEFENEARTNFLAIAPYDIYDMPQDCPTGAELQDFFYNKVRPEVEAAISNCAVISDAFAVDWTVPYFEEQVHSDYADVKYLKAMLELGLAAIQAQYHYDMNADFDAMMRGEQTMQDLFENGFLTPAQHWDLRKWTNVSMTLMTDSRDSLFAALNDFWEGVGCMSQREGDYTYFEDLLDLPSEFTNTSLSQSIPWPFDLPDSLGYEFTLTELLNALTNEILDEGVDLAQIYTILELMGVETGSLPALESARVNPFVLWDYGGVDFNAVLPGFEGDRVVGLFSDGSIEGLFGGSVGNIPLADWVNMDINQDGAVDLAQWLDPVDFLPILYEDLVVEDLYGLGDLLGFDPEELLDILPFFLDDSLVSFAPALIESILYDYVPEQIGIFFEDHLNDDLQYSLERFLPLEAGIPVVEFFVDRAAQFCNPPEG